jgi:hypothetical protein
MDPGDKLYNFNLNEVVDALNLHGDSLVVPVFDGVPPQSQEPRRERQPVDPYAYDAFMLGSQITHWGRVTAEIRPVPWVHYNTGLRNLAEPTFSDSARAPLLQLADVVGYLLGVADRVAQVQHSDWKARVASIACRIDRALVHSRSVTVHIQPPE